MQVPTLDVCSGSKGDLMEPSALVSFAHRPDVPCVRRGCRQQAMSRIWNLFDHPVGPLVMADQADVSYGQEQTSAANRAYSITSSAMASSPGGKPRPNALAVLRLITNSNLVDCMTGKSPGFSPFKILHV